VEVVGAQSRSHGACPGVIVIVLLPAVIFLAAWTLRWWNAWAYYAAVLVGALSSRLAIALRHPDLPREPCTSM
jgi:hypothetical protein